MGRNKVLQDREAFLKVGDNRVFDDLSASGSRLLGLGHKTTHSRKLANLFFRTPRARVKHHVDGIESLAVVNELAHRSLSQAGVGVGPNVNNLIVALVVGN